jgi:hypothetical protein
MNTCECDPLGEGLAHHAWCGRAEEDCPDRGLHLTIPGNLRCATCGYVAPAQTGERS